MPSLRLDREISIRMAQPCLKIVGRRTKTVPILMYHSIRRELGGRHPYFEINTTPELFAQHMQFLRENGYSTVDLREAVEAVMVGRHGHKQVVITFDDGYRDFYTHAFPVLVEHGFKATVFVVSGLTGDARMRHMGNEYLTWAEIREMHAAGIRIGSHTVSHPELYKLNPHEIEYEIRQSKETIEQEIGDPIRSFSYPYAFPEHDKGFVDKLKGLLRTHGYDNGVSTVLGTAGADHDWYFLPRLPVNSYDDLRFLEAKLEGGYDWLHTPQYLAKEFKHLFSKPGFRVFQARGLKSHDIREK